MMEYTSLKEESHWKRIREYTLSKEIEHRFRILDIHSSLPICCERLMLIDRARRVYRCVACGTEITEEYLIYGDLKRPLNISPKRNAEHIFKHNAIARKDWFK